MRLSVLVLPAALLLAACGREPAPPPAPAEEPARAAQAPDFRRDYHSYANTQDFVTRHLVLDLHVDFERRILRGTAELQLTRLSDTADELVLDTRDLDISTVEAAATDQPYQPAAFALDAADPILGSALRIVVPAGADRVRVRYATAPQASGLQWVPASQTADGIQPFLYTQSQAIHARSWIPLQDTPQVRITFDARVRTPDTVLAIMGAENDPRLERSGDYRFRMPQPIPSYLIALAVGDLQFRPLGARTGVYAEPSVVAAAAREFTDTETMLEISEKLYGPYRWGRYDLVILPPSFPYGGMENPRLTFASPTVIAGDKSLVSLVAHELAHSWSGNLVTNATWRDFWLNEGFTNHLTYRIMEEVFGRERGDMERVLSVQALRRTMADTPPGDRALAVDLRGRDPDDNVTSIPYNRGALFLANLEAAFGRETFDAFLTSWFDGHAFTSQTTEDFIAYLDAELLQKQPGVFSRDLVDQWIFSPDLPDAAVFPQSDAFAAVDTQRDEWLAGTRAVDAIEAEGWSMHQWAQFLNNLPDGVDGEHLAALDAHFNLSGSGNAVLRRDWFKAAIDRDYRPAYPALQQHLESIGRMFLIVPLYRALVETGDGRAFAQRVYAGARSRYHPIAQTALDRIVDMPEPES